ncbi:MAG TPA: ABC transporter permease subunit [Actinocrinis sp.]|nr:ABC transporter permease subunit [Actinocrinis sp.]
MADRAASVPAETTSRATPRKARKPKTHLSPVHRRDWRLALLLITPAAVGFAFFAAYPVIRGGYLGFTTFHVLSPPKWVGLANFRQLLHDDVFWNSLRVTVSFVLMSVLFGVLLSLVTAVVLHRLTRSTMIRGLIILPFLISGVVAAVAWSWMLDTQLGIVNNVLEELTGHTVMFLGSPTWALPSVAAISVWKSMGYNAILLFAGLKMIPGDVYEAARLDGAGELAIFRRITVPLLRPVLVVVAILTVIGSFQVFDLVQVTTQGGPANSSNVLQMYIYDKAFTQFDFGYASTMSLALFALLIAITFTQMRLARANEADTDDIWAGTKHPDQTWKWVSYMGSAECQTLAGKSGSFFPSIPAAMDASAQAMKAQGVDWSVFTQYQKDGSLYPAVVYGNGAALQQAMQPLLDGYFGGSRGDDVFAQMQSKSKQILAGGN